MTKEMYMQHLSDMNEKKYNLINQLENAKNEFYASEDLKMNEWIEKTIIRLEHEIEEIEREILHYIEKNSNLVNN